MSGATPNATAAVPATAAATAPPSPAPKDGTLSPPPQTPPLVSAASNSSPALSTPTKAATPSPTPGAAAATSSPASPGGVSLLSGVDPSLAVDATLPATAAATTAASGTGAGSAASASLLLFGDAVAAAGGVVRAVSCTGVERTINLDELSAVNIIDSLIAGGATGDAADAAGFNQLKWSQTDSKSDSKADSNANLVRFVLGQKSFDQCSCSEIEESAEYLELVCSKLHGIEAGLTQQIAEFKYRQIRDVQSYIQIFENKNAALIEELKVTRTKEADVRARVDSLSHATQKAKNSVATAKHLWGSPPPAAAGAGSSTAAATSSPASASAAGGTAAVATAQASHSLGVVREQRASALKSLEQLVTLRTVAANEILNVSSIVAELRADTEKRNYAALAKAIASKFFLRAFGAVIQTNLLALIKTMHSQRENSRACARKLSGVRLARAELRKRIAILVTAFWK